MSDDILSPAYVLNNYYLRCPQALDKMEEEWEPILLEIIAYKETGTYIMRSGDESAQQLDDHIVMTQAMSFSPYKKPFEARIMTWENKLRITQDVMEEWSVVYFCLHLHIFMYLAVNESIGCCVSDRGSI